ncbi:hypothetical protein KR018_007795 [Drosophila ironensis]|nr:hypothetical protein KR018_007795 [Drosophila ironensis]
MCKSVIISLALLAVASTATAQSVSCVQANGIDFNNTAFPGEWYEVARNPAPSVGCVILNVALTNTSLLVNVTHSISTTNLNMGVRETANITLTSGNTNGYNVSFVGSNSQTYKYIKLLQIIDNNYLVGCSYTDANNASTSAGFILARGGYSDQIIKEVNNNASTSFNNFQNNTYFNVTQTGCFTNSAGQTLPLVSLFLAIALLLIKA